MRTGKNCIIFIAAILISTLSSLLYSQGVNQSANVDNILDKSNIKAHLPHDVSENPDPSQSNLKAQNANNTPNNAPDTENPQTATAEDTLTDPNLGFSPTAIVTLEPANEKDTAALEKLVKDWTQAFNKKDLSATCGLFSKNIVANYRGLPPKNHKTICEGFKKIFADKSSRYEYKYKIHNIYRSNDLAIIRITWFLNVFRGDQKIAMIQDEGMDVLTKNDKDQWQIINYIAYQK